jgi:intein/homing endonuclease
MLQTISLVDLRKIPAVDLDYYFNRLMPRVLPFVDPYDKYDSAIEQRHVFIYGKQGCLTGDTRVALGNGAIVELRDLGRFNEEGISQFVKTGKGSIHSALATTFFKYPPSPIIEVVLESGKNIKGTPNHPILIQKPHENRCVWTPLSQLKSGDKIKVATGLHWHGGKQLRKTGWKVYKTKHKTFQVQLPEFCDEQLAALLGLLISDGYIHRKRTVNFYLARNEADLIDQIRTFTYRLFKAPIAITQSKHSKMLLVSIHRTPIARAFAKIVGGQKRIPRIIWESRNSVMASFLSWLFEGDGSIGEVKNQKGHPNDRWNITLASTNVELLRDVQLALLRWRIHSRVRPHNGKTPAFVLHISRNESIRKFANQIVFPGKVKAAKLTQAVNSGSTLTRTRGVSGTEKVMSVKRLPPEPVYDIEVPSTSRFIANGIHSHNSGKTNVTKLIVNRAVETYGAFNVAVQRTNAENFRQLLEGNWERKPIQVIILEDATDVGIPKDELADFFRIRHKMYEKTGAREGLVIMIFCCHRLHETPIALRSDYDSLLVLGVPMNDWDYNFIASKVGIESVEVLDEADENNEKGNVIITYRRKFLGIAKIPKLTFSIPIRDITPPPANNQGTSPYYRQRMQAYQPRPDNPEPVRVLQLPAGFRPENVIRQFIHARPRDDYNYDRKGKVRNMDNEMGSRFTKSTERKINIAVPIILFIISTILYEAGYAIPYFKFH